MGRDLSFWKYRKGKELNDEIVYCKLTSGIMVNEVEELPIKDIYATIQNVFENWNWKSRNFFEKNGEGIEIYMTDQFVRFDCYSVSIENMNMIIDIMGKYECPLYDSAISTRFSI